MGHSFNFVDLFAGAGGLSCGLEMSGHRCLLGVDFDKHAMNTFARNHPQATTYCGDISLLTKEMLKTSTKNKPVHLVVGGPPCQGFSTVGRGDPNDKRNHLFRHFLRVVKELNPYFVIMENVTGLLAQKNEKTLKAIIQSFRRLGFDLHVQVVSMEKYGVPERRRRTIFLGSRINHDITFPLPTHENPVTVGEALQNLKAIDGKIYNHQINDASLKHTIDKERLKRIPEGKSIRYQCDEEEFLPPRLRMGVDWDKMREGRFRQAKYFRISRGLPSPTILTDRHVYYHPTENRHLTVREAAKLQSFPNEFIFEGPLTAQWRQIGNAVPPVLGKVLGDHLKELYKNRQKQNKPLSSHSRDQLVKTIDKIRGKAFVYKERPQPSSKN